MTRLSVRQRQSLLELISSCDPRHFRKLPQLTVDSQLKTILRFYVPLPKEAEAEIWARQKSRARNKPEVPEDERVEDAGLDDESVPGRAANELWSKAVSV